MRFFLRFFGFSQLSALQDQRIESRHVEVSQLQVHLGLMSVDGKCFPPFSAIFTEIFFTSMVWGHPSRYRYFV